jgi:hypothetical protein
MGAGRCHTGRTCRCAQRRRQGAAAAAQARAGMTLHICPERSQRPCTRQGGCLGGGAPGHTCRAGRQRASGGVQQAGAAAGGGERWRRSVGLFLARSTPAKMPNIHIPPHSVDSSRTPKFRHSPGGSRGPGARMAGLDGRSGTARRRIFAFRLTGTFPSTIATSTIPPLRGPTQSRPSRSPPSIPHLLSPS